MMRGRRDRASREVVGVMRSTVHIDNIVVDELHEHSTRAVLDAILRNYRASA